MIKVKIVNERIEHEDCCRHIYGLEEELEKFYIENNIKATQIIHIEYHGTPYSANRIQRGSGDSVNAYAVITYEDGVTNAI